MSESTDFHRTAAAGQIARCALLTVSDSRTAENDRGGDTLVAGLIDAGHEIIDRQWVRDEAMEIGKVLTQWLGRGDLQVIFTTGGTGISRRDTTVEVVERFLEKRLDGFGELFRMLSFQEVGPAAMLSRSVAGLARGIVVFALPGSVAAVELALERLILPELEHLVWERQR
ncbi:MAG: MogA/MoaB family molybdenum cofactor biosynthesis protein [bacterium]|nr:MogA/MoaB family molybdenum cofactor biosynthesis protein [bacterium]